MSQEQRVLVEEWLGVHRALIAAELAFAGLAKQAAAGELSLEELGRERSSLMRLRAHCTDVYQQAFARGVCH